ncbi:MAG: hypothetical protein LBM67_08140 [Lentimicrobiaceae bacterium]|jgi:signal transduction histidine kinase|nr:hypothetical protein [Lentimicrobiaceae bacterium]
MGKSKKNKEKLTPLSKDQLEGGIIDGHIPLKLFTTLKKLGFLEYDIVADRFNYMDPELKAPDDFNWKQYLDRMHPDDREVPAKFMDDVKANKISEMKICYRFMPYLVTEYEWFDTIFFVSERDKEGNPLKVLKLFWIITEEKNKELKLISYLNFYELALSKLSVYLALYTVLNDRLVISKETNEEGCSLKEYIDKAVHPEDQESFWNEFRSFLNKGYVENSTFNIKFRIAGVKEENFEWVEFTGAAVEAAESGKITKIAGIGQIITEKLAREAKLKEAKKMLEFSLKASNIVPWEFTLDKKKSYLPNLQSISSEATISLENHLTEFALPEHRQEVLNIIDQIRKGEKETIDIKIREKTADTQKEEWVHLLGQVIKEDDRSAKKAFGVMRFISKEIEREQELIRLRDLAEESNRLKSTFLANMSHEIRTPLNAIVGFSKLIPTAETQEEADEFNRIITANNDLLLQLINDILDLSKIEAGQMEFSDQEIDLVTMLSDIYQSYQTRIKGGVTLEQEIPNGKPTIFADKNRISQVVTNFLNNAIKFTQKGSITIGYSLIGNEVRVFVRDTGIGVSKENQAKIFDRFTKLNSHIQGTGLGLSISQTIIEHYNGTIGVESKEGKGSEFWFTLPAKPIEN